MSESEQIGNGAGPRAIAPVVPTAKPNSADAVREADFPVVMRGYDRRAVDEFLGELADLVDVLEARQARESVVQRALDEVGEETSTILKHAHELADEVTARSRAQAEDRLERARREAEEIVADARAEAETLIRDTEELWDKRSSLLDDLRELGGDAVVLASRTEDRLPRPVPEAREEAPTEVVEPAPEADDAPYDGDTEESEVL